MTLAFVSYNSKDREAALRLAETLKAQRIDVWLDQWELRPGFDWMPGIEDGLAKATAVLVLVGPHGVGNWEQDEYRAALDEQKRRGCPVIPVFLPGYPEDFLLPIFLRNKGYVDLRSTTPAQALDELIFGITGIRPSAAPQQPQQPGPAATDDDDRAQAAEKLADYLVDDNISIFLGLRLDMTALSDFGPSSVVARQLLAKLPLLSKDDTLVTADLAGSLFALKEGEMLLETAVLKLLADRSRVPDPFLARLTSLVQLLSKRPPVRGKTRSEVLIVSTSPSLSLERALVLAGIPFTRLVQMRSAPKLAVNEITHVERRGDRLQVEGYGGFNRQYELADIDEAIHKAGYRLLERGTDWQPSNQSADRGGGVILYKFLGSEDLRNSCSLSSDQQLLLTTRLLTEHAIPSRILEILENTPILFLGSRFLDPDFRLAYYALLRESLALTSELNFAPVPRPRGPLCDPYLQLEEALWEKLRGAARKRHVQVVDAAADEFLADICVRLDRALASRAA